MDTILPLEYASPAKQPAALSPLARGLVIVLCVLLSVLIVLASIPNFSSRSGQARVAAARTDISALATALDAFKQDIGRYPTSAEGLGALVIFPGAGQWRGPYISKSVPNDPWGHPYLYQCPGKRNSASYDLSSAGKDGKPGTADDILNQ